MKALILSLTALIFSTVAFATHYQQKGKVGEEKSLYIVNDGMLMKAPMLHAKPFYEFYSDCSGLKNKESGLIKTGLSEYQGQSGRIHEIADLFATYERRANRGGGELAIESTHDKDVVCILNSTGTTYTIDIYTGKDAKEYLASK